MCDVNKYFGMFNDMKKLHPEDTLQRSLHCIKHDIKKI